MPRVMTLNHGNAILNREVHLFSDTGDARLIAVSHKMILIFATFS